MEERMVIMKRIIIIILVLISFVSYSQSKIVLKGGGTGAGAISTASFNVVTYGAIGDGTTNSTTAIQAALDAAHVSGGIVYFPSGTYRTNKITSYTNVTIKGDGFVNSHIRSLSADTLIVIRGIALANFSLSTYSGFTNTLIEDINLKGGGLGTVGLCTGGSSNAILNFRIGRVLVDSFASKGFVLYNTLIGTINDCHFRNNPTGIYAANLSGAGSAGTNSVTIANTAIVSCSKWAIDWGGGGQLKLEKIDLEVNGVASDTTTGGVYFHNDTWPGGLYIDGGWAEENLGTVINISGGNVPYSGSNYPNTTTHTIIGFQDIGQQYTFTTRNINLSGANQRLVVIGSSITGATTSIVADGANTNVNVMGSKITNSIMRGGAAITTIGN